MGSGEEEEKTNRTSEDIPLHSMEVASKSEWK